jgi:hypothetical protein
MRAGYSRRETFSYKRCATKKSTRCDSHLQEQARRRESRQTGMRMLHPAAQLLLWLCFCRLEVRVGVGELTPATRNTH